MAIHFSFDGIHWTVRHDSLGVSSFHEDIATAAYLSGIMCSRAAIYTDTDIPEDARNAIVGHGKVPGIDSLIDRNMPS